MKEFEIPSSYRSSLIGPIKTARKILDSRKKDFSPSKLDFGPVQFYLARHFGFCYGVENAIEIAYRAIAENPDKRIFLLSQMIHNPAVNEDLKQMNIRFIMDTQGNQLIDWDEIKSEDVVITPAFGTTIEIENILKDKGIELQKYNTTCPFVTKVWKQSDKLGKSKFSVIIHGKQKHEETRATLSHSSTSAPSVVVTDMEDAKKLGDIIMGKIPKEDFYGLFQDKYTKGFDVEKDLDRVGVVNQTTMLASDTQAIADYFKELMELKFGAENIKDHFADSRDTLCYATNDNQQATFGLLEEDADLAIVVGGYNSSNTSHIVELCESKFPTYFISGAHEILSDKEIAHYNYSEKKKLTSSNYLPEHRPVKIVLTSGASCPDAVVEEVLQKLLSYFPGSKDPQTVLKEMSNAIPS